MPGLKKNRTSNLIRVLDDMIPEKRLSNPNSFLSSFSAHNRTIKTGQTYSVFIAKDVPTNGLIRGVISGTEVWELSMRFKTTDYPS